MSERLFFRDSSIYIRAAQESRYLNINLMFNVQSAFGIPQAIRESASIVFVKRLNDRAECRIMSDMLGGLTEEQIKMLMHLQVFEGIIINKEQDAVPVPVLIPKYPAQHVTDEMIENHQGEAVKKLLSNIVRKKPVKHSKTQRVEELDHQLTLVLENFRQYPFLFQWERKLHLGLEKISDSIDTLCRQGFLIRYPKKFNLGKGRPPFQPYILSDKASAKFGNQKIEGKAGDGLEHSFWQERCSMNYTKLGYKFKKEYFLKDGSNRSVDGVASKGSEKIAIEIELSPARKHIKSNIVKCINANENFDRIIIAVYGQSIMKMVQEICLSDLQLEECVRNERLEIRFITEFLN
jgi:hypothetical protein